MGTEASDCVLLVDDEQAVLDALVRRHRKHFTLATACGSAAGLRAIAQEGPFAVVVSDFQMPGMDGIEFLGKVRDAAPDAIRVMLTGQADLRVSIEAINRGNIFRFLTKPCSDEDFRMCLSAALEQHRLQNAERLLLENTVRGSIEVLAEVLSLSNPTAFGRATKIRGFVRHVVRVLNLPDAWQYETAALLSQIGWIAVPDDLIDRLAAGEPLSEDQNAVIDRQPEIARDLLKKIPRLQVVAEMVYHQTPRSKPSPPADALVRLGGEIIGAALQFEELLSLGASTKQALDSLRKQGRGFDRRVLDALASCAPGIFDAAVSLLPLAHLRPGMLLDEDIRNNSGALLVPRGHELSRGSIERLRSYAELKLLPKHEFSVRAAGSDRGRESSAA